MPLRKDYLPQAANFVLSPLWQEYKRALLEARPPKMEPSDAVSKQAADGFIRQGFEQALEDLEKIHTLSESAPTDPFDRPALDPRD